MKRLFILTALFLFTLNGAYALNDAPLKDIGIAKYAVLEISRDYSPVRYEPNINARRFSHLRKGVVMYADKQMGDFYRVDLGLNNYYWIEKKFVEVQGVIPNKLVQDVKKIEFRENKKKYNVLIPMDIQNSYSFVETSDGLKFSLYDVNYTNAVNIKNKSGSFNFSSWGKSVLNMQYISPALFGYDVKTNKEGLLVEVKKIPKINPKKPLNNIKIVVDPGHGGEETGVCAFDYQEKDVNLQMSKKVKKALEKKGAKVYMTRKRDKYVALYDRINFAQEKEADILISIHQNSLANPKDVINKHGVGVYYYNKQAKPLAQSIQDSLVKQSGFRDDGVNFASFALNRPTNPVSVLVECGYLIDKNEMEKLTDKKFQKIYSKALADGVENYMRYIVVY